MIRIPKIIFCIIILLILVSSSISFAASAFTEMDSVYSVRNFGAKGNGITDDTTAFQRALNAATKEGGTVFVPSVGAGRGYVITRTLRVPPGVTLMGSMAGLTNNAFPWPPFPLPDNRVIGAKIFARPTADQYMADKKKPLFLINGGSTVRGFWIIYDKQPWPTNQEFQDPRSPYYYETFGEARASFIREHVKPYGPTFYTEGFPSNIVIEDIVCDRFYDFYYQTYGGKAFINRVCGYGYGRGFVFQECGGINRISQISIHPSAGPVRPDPDGNKKYDWIYGIISSQEDNIGVQIGRSDGYVFDDISFWGVHTAIRLGASKAYPLHNPVENTDAYFDSNSEMLYGFQSAYKGYGPWGSVSNLNAEACAIGIQFVWPAPLPNKLSNAWIATGVDDGKDFSATAGTGNINGITKQAAFVVEPTYTSANSANMTPIFLCTNAVIGSFQDTLRQGRAAAHVLGCNGRLMLIDGDITMDLTNFVANYPYSKDLLCAKGVNAQKALVRIRGFTLAWNPMPDMHLDGGLAIEVGSANLTQTSADKKLIK